MPGLMSYYGSKYRLASKITAEFPDHYCYVETCGGSAAVLLKKQASPIEVLNDGDDLLVNFYQMLRTRTDDLHHVLRYTPYSRTEHDRCRKDIRHFIADPIERARCYYVSACQSYSGLVGCSFSCGATKGLGATWRSRVERLHEFAERLRPVIVENLDLVKLVQKYDRKTTLFYVDPPYLPETRTGRSRKMAKYRLEMTMDDHRDMLLALNTVKGSVLLSGYDSDLYARLLKGWRVVWREKVQQVWAMNLNRRDSQYRYEVLWANF